MNEILVFLNENAGALTVIFAAVVTLSTVAYAILTSVLVSETRKMREVQTEPKIQITIESLEIAIQIIRLNIKNIGLGPAYNISFTPSVICGDESAKNLLKEFTQSNFFDTGLRYFGPGQNIYSSYSQTTEDFEGKSTSVLSFKVDYESVNRKKYSDTIVIDMSEIKGLYQLGKPHLYSLAGSLEKIQKDISHIVSGYKRIKTNVYSSTDRLKEKEDLERWKKEQRKDTNT